MEDNKNEVNVLDELNKGACMGRDAIHFIIDKVENADLEKELTIQYNKYKEIINIDYKYDDKVVNDFYLTYKSFLLTYLLAQKTNKDLSIVDYSPVVKKLYKYNGNM